MPSEHEHLSQAERNERFAEHVLTWGDSDFTDWALTALFYAAVHYGRAYLAAKSVSWQPNHGGFKAAFVKTCASEALFRGYDKLKTRSERARYNCVTFTLSDVTALQTSIYEPFRDGLLALFP